MSRPALLLVLGLAGCSEFIAAEGGVAAIEIDAPFPAEVELGQERPLVARVFNADGDPLDVPVTWRALDTTVVVEQTPARVLGRTAGKTGRVIAVAGGLYSDPLTFTVLAPVDSLIRIAPEVLDVEPGGSASPALDVALVAGDPPEGVAGWRVRYEVVLPTFPSVEERTVEFAGGTLAQTLVTTSTGQPPPVTLRRLAGVAPPPEATVEVQVFRPSGAPVPGSGLRFTIRFLSP